LIEEIFCDSQFVNISNHLLGCPVILRVKNNETYHGTFVTFTAEFDVIIEQCRRISPGESRRAVNNSVVTSVTLTRQRNDEVHSQYFERETIVEMIACDVNRDYGK
jgi:small nuclear ribonucleoprotein (snRNP)-like protein